MAYDPPVRARLTEAGKAQLLHQVEYLNGIAVNTISVGVIGALVALVLEFDAALNKPMIVLLVIIVSLVFSAGLMLAGNLMLKELDNSDD